jgi:uncharacterized protein
MFGEGLGVPREDVQAYQWYSLSAAQGVDIARQNLSIAEGRMTREQIAQAQRMAAETFERIRSRE